MAVATVVFLAASACGGGGSDVGKADAGKADADKATEGGVGATATSTTLAVPANPLPAVPGGAAPLTALPASGPLDRPALVVKIDNAPKGRPQFGINQADVVYEEQVEGGITRLAAVFHSAGAEKVGPVRSARSTDLALAAPLGRPLFAFSGANRDFVELIRGAPLVDVGASRHKAAYRREPGRPSTYNLVSSTAALLAAAPGGSAPGPLFAYRGAGEPFAATGAAAVGRVSAEWRDRVRTAIDYQWDSVRSVWLRGLNGTPHLDAAGEQVAPANVVLQLVAYRDTGLRDTSGAPVPEAELVGEGEAWVASGGKLVRGRWRKGSLGAVTEYLDSAGTAVRLAPGRTWVSLVPPGGARVG